MAGRISFNLAAMRSRVRERADQENSAFISDGELDAYIQGSYEELYDLVLEAWGSDLFQLATVIPTVVNEFNYELPLDFYRLTNISIELGARHYVSLRELQLEELNLLAQVGQPTHYRLAASVSAADAVTPLHKFNVAPVPDSVWNMTVFYVPAPELLVVDREYPAFAGWDEWIVCDAAIKCLEKEESETSTLQGRLARLQQRILAAGPARNTAEAPRVQDRRSRHDYDEDPYFRRRGW